MARQTIDLETLERRAADEGSLPLAMAAQSIRDAALGSCVGCGIFAGSAAGFTLTREQCARLKVEYGPGPRGPLIVLPLCETCDQRCDVNAAFAAEVEERIMRLAEGGKVGMFGVERTG